MGALAAATLAGAAAACAAAGPGPSRDRLRRLVAGRQEAGAPELPRWSAAATGVTVGWAVGGGVAGALAGLVLGEGLRRARRRARAARAAGREREAAAEACAALAGELRAGCRPAEALRVAAEVATGPFGRRLSDAAGVAALGGDVAAALAAEPGGAVRHLGPALGACWQVCTGAGSGLSSAVARLEEGLRADAELRRLADAEVAGPRASAAMMSVLPLAGVALAGGLGAHPVSLLLHTPLGWACLGAGLGLDLLGLAWTRRLVRSAAGG